jgi:hypothetical protein
VDKRLKELMHQAVVMESSFDVIDGIHIYNEVEQLDDPEDDEEESPETALIDVCCATCGKNFKAEPYHDHKVNKNPNYYCSQECVRAGMNKAYEASKKRRPIKLNLDDGGGDDA